MIEILVDATPFDRRAALVVDGILKRILVDDPGADGPEAEALYVARIVKRERSMAGAFADLGAGVQAFLPEAAMDGESEGACVLAEVRRAALPGKSAVLGRPRLHGRTVLLQLPELKAVPQPGYDKSDAEELASLERQAREILAAFTSPSARTPRRLRPAPSPVERLVRNWPPGVPGRIAVAGVGEGPRLRTWLENHRPDLAGYAQGAGHGLLTEEGIEEAIERLRASEISLEGGGRVSLEPTRALLAVDVDGARALASAGRAGLAQAVNRAAARALPRELALRALGGLVVVDFIGQPRGRAAGELAGILKKALGEWGLQAEIGPISRFGVLEMTLPVRGPSLATRLGGAGLAAAALRALWAASTTTPGARLVLTAHPELQQAIAAREGAVKTWAEARGMGPWQARERADWPLGRFEVTPDAPVR